MLHAVAIALFVVTQVVAIVLIPLGLPGLWVQVAMSVAAGLWLGLAWTWVAGFAALAAVGEAIEFVSGQWGARRFGGSRHAAWGAFLGGFAGAVIGGIPVPVVGSVIASFLGTFAGAIVGETLAQRRVAPHARVAFGAVLGRTIGVASKVSMAFVIFVLSLVGVLW